MNKPGLKWKEVLLMVLPIGVLALVGVWMRGKAGPTLQMAGPFKFVVEETKFEPVTALEASSGYNTKLVVVLNHEGKTPAWWVGGDLGGRCGIGADPDKPEKFESYKKPGCWISGGSLTYKEGGATKIYPRPDRTSPMLMHAPHWDEKLQRYKMKFNMALTEVPEKFGEVTLKGALAAGLSATTHFSFVVRKAGEKIPAVNVSRYSPAALDKVEINNSGSETMVTLLLLDKEQKPLRKGGEGWSQSEAYLIDEHGNKYGTAGNPKNGWGGMITTSFGYDEKRQRYFTSYRFDMSPIQQSAGRLTFKTKIALDDHWPVYVSSVVRERANPQTLKANPQTPKAKAKPRPTQKPPVITHYKY